MCLIISSEQGKLVDLKDLEIAFSNNPHGAGIMFFDGERVRQHQIVTNDFGDVAALARYGVGYPHAIHLRYCTKGTITPDNCHPFTVLSKDEGDTDDVSIMHNGTFSWLHLTKEDNEAGRSDTAAFALKIQKNLRSSEKLSLDLLQNKEIVDKFSKRVSSWNKVVFLDSQGRFVYFNKSSGMTRNDMWYSNDYSLKEGYRDAQLSHHGPSTKTTTTTYSGSYSSGGSYNFTSTQEAPKRDSKKKGNVSRQVSFFRAPREGSLLYIREDIDGVSSFALVDPDRKCKVRTGERLGKSERKKMKRWLENEAKLNELVEEKRLERTASTDSKGRRTFTVAPGGTTKVEIENDSIGAVQRMIKEIVDQPKVEGEATSFLEENKDNDERNAYGYPGYYHHNMN